MLYVTPEMMCSSRALQTRLMRLHRQGKLTRFVIDEAHCLPTWGLQFRNSYLALDCLRQRYADVPILACTATATTSIADAVKATLAFHPQRTTTFFANMDRKNLGFEVRPKPWGKVEAEMAQIIHTDFAGKSGIIYCRTRRATEKVSVALNQCSISSEAYHAGQTAALREAVQNRWMDGTTKIIVATIAFGLGVDKPDVRFVFHHSFPKDMEGYYQETGRAGRDGLKSACILFFSPYDIKVQQLLIQNAANTDPEVRKDELRRLREMVDYCQEKTHCRRALITKYFGKEEGKCGKDHAMCDNCKRVHVSKWGKRR